MEYSRVVKKIALKEKELGLYDDKLLGVPIWRLVRFSIIKVHLRNVYGLDQGDKRKRDVSLIQFLKNYLTSAKQFFTLCFGGRQYKNIIFAFPRLQKVEEVYIDKFTDPIIDNSNLKGSSLIFQRHEAGKHKRPRYNSDKVVINDFIDVSAKLFGVVFALVVFIFANRTILRTYRKSQSYFSLNRKHFVFLTIRVGSFYFASIWYRLLFKRLNVHNAFFVDREIYYPAIFACKCHGVKVYELQHGITHSWTVLYSGQYNSLLDPDYFLSFGDYWCGKQFGIPVDKIENIGWAYAKSLKEKIERDEELTNSVLVISEPNESTNIINALENISKEYSHVEFHIRLHPEEEYSDEIWDKVSKLPKVKVVANTMESSIALLVYKFVLGVNSSVLYEALSLQKKVACLNFSGCISQSAIKCSTNPFVIINSTSDFGTLLKISEGDRLNIDNSFYSEFNIEKFNSIIQ